MERKIIFLNALVTSSKMPMTLKTRPVSLNIVREIIREKEIEIESYIGHEATANLLSSLLNISVPTNRSMYDPKPNDVAVIVRLKKRLEKPEDVKNVTENDIEFILVEYHEY
jgi:hypothetical protein